RPMSPRRARDRHRGTATRRAGAGPSPGARAWRLERSGRTGRRPRERTKCRPTWEAAPCPLADGRLLRPDPRADLPQQRGVVGVTGHARGDATTNRAAEQVEVAEDVEDLVAYELVGEAQRRVHHAVGADQDAVVQAAAAREPHLLE